MPKWEPDQRWTGRDVYIIGGGPSLIGFDFERLRGKATIGCNSAFRLGPELCNVCHFSDSHWYEKVSTELSAFTGDIVTHDEVLAREPGLKYMQRYDEGLHLDGLGSGGSTGCSAINLALLMGAARVMLLGLDCKPGPNHQTQPNWHNHHIEIVNTEVFIKFDNGFNRLVKDLPTLFPGRQIINLGPDSALTCFRQRKASLYI